MIIVPKLLDESIQRYGIGYIWSSNREHGICPSLFPPKMQLRSIGHINPPRFVILRKLRLERDGRHLSARLSIYTKYSVDPLENNEERLRLAHVFDPRHETIIQLADSPLATKSCLTEPLLAVHAGARDSSHQSGRSHLQFPLSPSQHRYHLQHPQKDSR
jgi:hypothetical protein